MKRGGNHGVLLQMKKLSLLLIVSFFFIGCGQFFRLTPQYDLPIQSLKAERQQGKTRVLFYNTTNLVLFGLDFTDKIDILLNNKNVGSARAREYILVDLEPKEYELNLTHYDALIKFSNTYKLMVSDVDMFVNVYNGLVSTKYKLDKQLPDKFDKRFEPAY